MIWAPKKDLWTPERRRGSLLFFPPLLRNRISMDPIQSGLETDSVAYYKLEEASGTRIDARGNGFDLTAFNEPVGVAGKVGGCCEFSGGFKHLDRVDNGLRAGPGSFSISCWMLLINKATERQGVTRWQTTGGQREYSLDYNVTLDRFRFIWSSLGTNSFGLNADSFGPATTDTWYFVVAWYDHDAGTVSIQVNDGVVDSVAFAGPIFASTAAFMLGQRATGGIANEARLDEVGLWRRVLTGAERTWLWNDENGRSLF